jgi:Flp pilus assembly pilin Flp
MRLLRFARQNSGSTAIEFGLTAPLFLLVVFGLFEGGIGLWTYFGLQSAAESAARYASVSASSSSCSGSGCVCSGGNCVSNSAVQTYASQNAMGLNLPGSTFSVTSPSCGWQVSATYTFTPLGGGNFGLPDFTFTAQACYPS